MNLTLNEAWFMIVFGLSGWIMIRELKISWLTQQLNQERQEKRLAEIEKINEVLTDIELDHKLDDSLGRKPKA